MKRSDATNESRSAQFKGISTQVNHVQNRVAGNRWSGLASRTAGRRAPLAEQAHLGSCCGVMF